MAEPVTIRRRFKLPDGTPAHVTVTVDREVYDGLSVTGRMRLNDELYRAIERAKRGVTRQVGENKV